jgi:RsiW-degrading membrane proteinase PrsW (M82 family)
METHPSSLLRLISTSGQPCYPLSPSQEIVIGRSPDCQILLGSKDYGGVSRRHASLRSNTPPAPQAESIWQICDLGSANGTFVNGQRLKGWHTLTTGDHIALGQNGPQFIFEHRSRSAAVQTPQPVQIPHSPGHDLSVSQLLPALSVRQDLLKKGFLIPGIVTVLVVVSLFATVGYPNPNLFNYLLALYLGCGAFFFIYRLCGQRKPLFVISFATLFTMMILVTPLLPIFALFYRRGLIGLILMPMGFALLVIALIKLAKRLVNHAAGWGISGCSLIVVGFGILASGDYVAKNLEDPTTGFLNQFISHFWGSGLMEELLKALPIFVLFAIGRRLQPPNRERIGVWEPLDGIVLGAASALGFTLVETVGQYVPTIMEQAAQELGANAGNVYAIQLLIPRILGSVAGHMAYSGYFGYFIGLSILKANKRIQILATGYLTAALLHAVWNATPSLTAAFGGLVGNILQMLVGVAAYIFLTGAILKARQLSPNRAKNFATQMAPPL